MLKRIVSIVFVIILTITAAAVYSPDAAALIYAYGIDVSYAQGANVNWPLVRASNISFAIIRIGYSKNKDAQFERNYAGAKNAGVNVGVYMYTYSHSVEEASRDADDVIAWLGGRKLEYPVYYDMEEESQKALSTSMRTAMCLEFCRKLTEAGYLSGVYASRDWLDNMLDRRIISTYYEIWVAAWHPTLIPDEDMSSYGGVWQYSNKGRLAGISNRVDMNVCYKDYPSIIRQNGLSGYTKQEAAYYISVPFVAPQAPTFTEIVTDWGGEYKLDLKLFSSTISDVPPGTDYINFLGDLNMPAPPAVFDGSGKRVTDETAPIGTGYTARILLVTYTICVDCDLDGDGEATPADARAALRNAVGLDTLNTFRKLAADVDKDGSVTAADARTILRVSVGLFAPPIDT